MATAKKPAAWADASGNGSVKPRSSKRAVKGFQFNHEMAQAPSVVLKSLNDTFTTKRLELFERIKIGRQTGAKTAAMETNGFFDSKVLSRTHAEIWCEKGKVFVKDVKSSNGTFVNSERLSAEGEESEPREIRTGDVLEFGIDIFDDETLLYKKVSCGISIVEMEFPTALHESETAGKEGKEVSDQSRREPGAVPPPVPERPSMQAIRALNLDGLAMQLQTDLELSKEAAAELEQAKLAVGSLANGSVSQQQSHINELQNKLNESSTKLEDISNEYGQLQQQLAEYKNKAAKERDGIIAERDSLLAARDKAVEELKIYQRQAESERIKHEEELRKSQGVMSQQQSEITQLKKISEDRRHDNGDVNNGRLSEGEKIKELQTQLTAMAAKLAAAVAQTEEERRKTESSSRTGQTMVQEKAAKEIEREEEWMRKLDKLQGQLKHLQENNVELGVRNNVLETKVLALERALEKSEKQAKSPALSPGNENVKGPIKTNSSAGKVSVGKEVGRKMIEVANSAALSDKDRSLNRHSVGGGFLSQISIPVIGISIAVGALGMWAYGSMSSSAAVAAAAGATRGSASGV